MRSSQPAMTPSDMSPARKPGISSAGSPSPRSTPSPRNTGSTSSRRELGLPAHLGERAAPPAPGLGGRSGRDGGIEPDVVEDLASRRAGYPGGRTGIRCGHAHGPRPLRARGRAARRPARLHGLARRIRRRPVYERQIEEGGDPHQLPPVVEELKAEARKRGLWNLFLPDERWGAGLTNLDYAHLAEITGRSPHIAPEAINCARARHRQHGGAGDVRHPGAAGAVARAAARGRDPLVLRDDRAGRGLLATRPTSRARSARDGDEYVVDARKWFITGAADARCKVAHRAWAAPIPTGRATRQHSMVLVPMDAPGVTVVRNMQVFGYTDQHGHVRDAVRERARARPPTSSARRAAASRSRRPASAPAASTTACARSGWPSGRSS